MANFQIDRTFDYFWDGSPEAVHVHPIVNAMRIQSLISTDNLNDNEVLLLDAIAEDLKEGIRMKLRQFYAFNWTNDRLDNDVRGELSLTNMNNQAQEFHPTQPFILRNINGQSLAVLFERMQQSNRLLSIWDISWSFWINYYTVAAGNSLNKPPEWVKKGTKKSNSVYLPTWQNHSDEEGVHINCASFAIAFKMRTSNTEALSTTKTRAINISAQCGWTNDVTIYNILDKIPELFPKFRITVIMPHLDDHSKHTREGREYAGYTTFSENINNYSGLRGTRMSTETSKHTIYLAYLPIEKHYGLVQSPKAYLESMGRSGRAWCGRCLLWCLEGNACNCIVSCPKELAYQNRIRKQIRIKNSKPCLACNLESCTGCIKKCRFCGMLFKKGYDPSLDEGHRCLIYLKPREEDFWQPGMSVGKKDSLPQLWVYDLESSMKRVSGVYTKKFETSNSFKTINGEIQFSNVEVSEHVVNLVVCRNIFDETSEKVYFGKEALKEFILDMVTINNGNNVVIAHNGSGYDSRLVFEEVLKLGIKWSIKAINRGSKFLTLKVRNTIFKDSLLFLPASLATLAKSFDLQMSKGTFPHLFNSEENYSYDGEIPGKEFFDMTFFAKSQKEIDVFNTWYELRKQTPWNFKKELIDYCRDDVKILAQIVLKFHDICMNKFKMSPWFSSTGPGFAHKTIIAKLSENLKLPKEPPKELIEDLVSNNWAVLRPTEYFFAREALRGGRTDVRRLRYTLTAEDVSAGRKIKYVDVVSMYPAVQVKCDYPVGTPKIIIFDNRYYPCSYHVTPDFGNNSTQCQCSYQSKVARKDKFVEIFEEEDQPPLESLMDPHCFGFICVSMQPPKNLFHPVLVTFDEKCIASLEIITGKVFTTIEFQEAVRQGYQILKVHSIHLYCRRPGLWSPFIKDLYIEKLANSGPIDFEAQEKLVTQYEEKFGMGDAIREALPRFKYDGALRSVFKTLLNCGWGKHCQRPSLIKTEIKHTKDKNIGLFNNVQNGSMKIKQIHKLGGDYTMFKAEVNGERSPPNLHNSYLPAGVFVPAHGRLLLLEQMTKLGERVLYHDTDSIIYIYDPLLYNVPESEIWGDWDEESISKEGITSFVSIAPKSYALKTPTQELIKLKGLSIKNAHKDFVNFDLLYSFVDSYLENEPKELMVPQMNFTYKPGEGMRTTQSFKILDFKPENLKGYLHDNLIIYPFGYCKDCIKNSCLLH